MFLFDLNRWQEIGQTILANKLRTALTGLSVAWGIFMLVVLQGAGTGLEHGVESQFADDATNAIWLFPRQTSLPYQGQPPGRRVQLDERDFAAIHGAVDEIDHITGRYYIAGQFTVSYKNQFASFDVRGCHPDHLYLERTIITRGRFLNKLDLEQRRKVTVIGNKVVDMLFVDGDDPLGQWININGIQYRVVGLYTDEGDESEQEKIYIPITTAQTAYGGGDSMNQIMFTLGSTSGDRSKVIAEDVRSLLATRHRFSPDDERAVGVRNLVERFESIGKVISGIRVFVWVVAFGTIIAGIVGVSNIMLISVKERTKEIGLRKALGATPRSVVWMVLSESVLITSVAGYLGLVAGVGVLEIWSRYGPSSDFFRRPEAALSLAVTAIVLLVLFGTLAGLFPALRAARVNPVVALRDE